MKNTFKGFYNPIDEEVESAWKDPSTLFVFDANVLLNLYSYSEKTRNDFLKTLEKINDQIWLPYQAALEYQRRRLEVIKNQKLTFSKINEAIEKIDNSLPFKLIELKLKDSHPELHKKTEELIKEIKKLTGSYKRSLKNWEKKQLDVRNHDPIRVELHDLFEKKVGAKPENQDYLRKLYQDGKQRYAIKMPPGYMDNRKKDNSDNLFMFDGIEYQRHFGDLILWKQILEKTKSNSVKKLIFITDDSKEDWWYIIDSSGKKQIGPRAELQQEFYTETNAEFYYMYNTSGFMEYAKQVFDLKIDNRSILDANTAFLNSIKARNKTLENVQALKELKALNSLIRDQATDAMLPAGYKDFLDKASLAKSLGLTADFSTLQEDFENISAMYQTNKKLIDALNPTSNINKDDNN